MIRNRNTLIGKRGPIGVAAASPPPVNTVPPSIAGTDPYFVGSTLTVTPGTWTNSPVLTYQWRSNGTDIPGATSTTYVIGNAYQGTTIDVLEIPNGVTLSGVDSNNLVAFIVTQIADVELWLDAADTGTITHAAGLVSSWLDKSGNLYTATQSSDPAKPITGTRTINGLNAIDFNGTTQFFNVSGPLTIAGANHTAYALEQSDALTGSQQILAGAQTGTSTRYSLQLDPSSNRIVTNSNPSNIPVNATATANTNPNIMGMKRSGTALLAFYNANQGTAASAADMTSFIIFRIGSTAAGSSFFNGLIPEIILLSRDTTLYEDNLLGGYLASKWGI